MNKSFVKAGELLYRLNSCIKTAHKDMDGKNKYILSAGAHQVIDEIKIYFNTNAQEQQPEKKITGSQI